MITVMFLDSVESSRMHRSRSVMSSQPLPGLNAFVSGVPRGVLWVAIFNLSATQIHRKQLKSWQIESGRISSFFGFGMGTRVISFSRVGTRQKMRESRSISCRRSCDSVHIRPTMLRWSPLWQALVGILSIMAQYCSGK